MTRPYIIQDPYFKKAKELWYRARSAFKLLEIQDKYKILQPRMKVLDVGAAPGSFLQVIAKIVGSSWMVVGIDIQKIDPNFGFPNIHLLQESVFEYDAIRAYIKTLGVEQFDCITSDIAPSTTGITGVDQYKSIELNLAILDVAREFLRPGWTVILKVFVGEDILDLIHPIKAQYKKLSRMKPKACRDRSFEEYFICQWKM